MSEPIRLVTMACFGSSAGFSSLLTAADSTDCTINGAATAPSEYNGFASEGADHGIIDSYALSSELMTSLPATHPAGTSTFKRYESPGTHSEGLLTSMGA